MKTMQRHRVRDDSGSLMLGLLVAIVVGGLAVVIVSVTMSGTQMVRSDRDFQHAINGADAGVRQAATYLIRNDVTDVSINSEDLDLDTVSGDVDFRWVATQETPISWRIESWGTRGGAVRKVEAEIAQDNIFFVAAFADLEVEFRGGNRAYSYDEAASNTGEGAVGSNGLITFPGNATADRVFLMGSAAELDCYGGGGTKCDQIRITGDSDTYDLDAVYADMVARMEQECSSYEPYYPSVDGPLGPGIHCFSYIYDNNNHGEWKVTATSDDHAIVFVDGDVTLPNHYTVNCPDGGCDVNTSSGRPDSSALQLYVTGDVSFGNQGHWAMALVAPQGYCGSGGSNAQGTLYGSMVCETIDNVGGWTFWYDERLRDIGAGQLDVVSWREEVGGSTSFD